MKQIKETQWQSLNNMSMWSPNIPDFLWNKPSSVSKASTFLFVEVKHIQKTEAMKLWDLYILIYLKVTISMIFVYVSIDQIFDYE